MKNLPTVENALSIGELIMGHDRHSALVGEVIKMTEKAIFIHYRWDIVFPGAVNLDKEFVYESWIPKSVLEIKALKCEGNHCLIEIKKWFMKKGIPGREIRKARMA